MSSHLNTFYIDLFGKPYLKNLANKQLMVPLMISYVFSGYSRKNRNPMQGNQSFNNSYGKNNLGFLDKFSGFFSNKSMKLYSVSVHFLDYPQLLNQHLSKDTRLKRKFPQILCIQTAVMDYVIVQYQQKSDVTDYQMLKTLD